MPKVVFEQVLHYQVGQLLSSASSLISALQVTNSQSQHRRMACVHWQSEAKMSAPHLDHTRRRANSNSRSPKKQKIKVWKHHVGSLNLSGYSTHSVPKRGFDNRGLKSGALTVLAIG